MNNYIALLQDDKAVNNRLGYHAKITDILRNWDKELQQFCKHLTDNKFPIGYTLFVPDFFAITFGTSQVLQQKEIAFLWRSIVEVSKVLKFQKEQNQVTAVQVRKPYLGTQFTW